MKGKKSLKIKGLCHNFKTATKMELNELFRHGIDNDLLKQSKNFYFVVLIAL